MKQRKELLCLECGQIHFKLECQLTRGRGKFCSRECANKHRQHRSVVVCTFCKHEFLRRFGEQGISITQFCSTKCYSNYRLLKSKKTTYLKCGKKHIHILIAEKSLNRKLTNGEVVHHIDGDRHNNSIHNLAILPSQNIHAKIHFGNYDFEKHKLINLMP